MTTPNPTPAATAPITDAEIEALKATTLGKPLWLAVASFVARIEADAARLAAQEAEIRALRAALLGIRALATPRSNGTVRRMASVAFEALLATGDEYERALLQDPAMASEWDGVPKDPDEQALHLFADRCSGDRFAAEWYPKRAMWLHDRTWVFAPKMAATFTYHGPLYTAADLAAARREAHPVLWDAIEKIARFPFDPANSAMTMDEVRKAIAAIAAAAIRARGGSDAG